MQKKLKIQNKYEFYSTKLSVLKALVYLKFSPQGEQYSYQLEKGVKFYITTLLIVYELPLLYFVLKADTRTIIGFIVTVWPVNIIGLCN